MIHINKFLDKMSAVESRQAKDLVLPITEARGLRDEVSKLLSDLYELRARKDDDQKNDVIQIEVKGGSFK